MPNTKHFILIYSSDLINGLDQNVHINVFLDFYLKLVTFLPYNIMTHFQLISQNNQLIDAH